MRRRSCVEGCGIVRRSWVVIEVERGYSIDDLTIFSHGDELYLGGAEFVSRTTAGTYHMTVLIQTALLDGTPAT